MQIHFGLPVQNFHFFVTTYFYSVFKVCTTMYRFLPSESLSAVCVCPKTDALLTFHNFHNYLSSCLSNIQLRVTSNLLQHFLSCCLINFSPRFDLHHPWFGIQLRYIGWRESLRRAAAHHNK